MLLPSMGRPFKFQKMLVLSCWKCCINLIFFSIFSFCLEAGPTNEWPSGHFKPLWEGSWPHAQEGKLCQKTFILIGKGSELYSFFLQHWCAVNVQGLLNQQWKSPHNIWKWNSLHWNGFLPNRKFPNCTWFVRWSSGTCQALSTTYKCCIMGPSHVRERHCHYNRLHLWFSFLDCVASTKTDQAGRDSWSRGAGWGGA